MIAQTQIGPSFSQNGVLQSLRGGKLGDGIFSELHGRFYEQNYNGALFCSSLALTSIANTTFQTTAALNTTLATAAAATPIIGLWNPASSTVNAVILQATLSAIITASTVTGAGGLQWCVYLGNTNITVASQQAPVNCKTLAASGSQCKGISTLAMTGLSNTGILLRASCLQAGPNTNYSQVGTAVGFPATPSPSVENVDGSIIVPPGGILGLFGSGATAPVAISVIPGLLWEEVPV